MAISKKALSVADFHDLGRNWESPRARKVPLRKSVSLLFFLRFTCLTHASLVFKSNAKSDVKPTIPKPMSTLIPDNVLDDCESNKSVEINGGAVPEDRSVIDSDFGVEIGLSEFYFKPIYAIGAWQKPDDNDNRYVSIAILLFTGQDTTSSYSVDVVDGGNYLKCSVIWPIPFENPRLLHRKWIEVTGPHQIMHYHPIVTCFNQFIRRLRGDRERIRTTARIPLPFPVETDVDEHLLKFPGTSARVLYCAMRAPAQKTRKVEERELVFE